MTKINAKAKTHIDKRIDQTVRTGGGGFAARQDAEALLRRATLACLLFEPNFYSGGDLAAENIRNLIPQVAPATVAAIAIESREKQKLRHVPLFIVREMARLNSHKHLVAQTLARVITRADQMADFLALYWADGRQPLSAQVKKGLAAAFAKFNEYQLAKYRGDGKTVKLRDVMFLSHAFPLGGIGNTKQDRKAGVYDDALFRRVALNELATPDTWEAELSAGKDKRQTWERLITEKKLGGLAFLRNLRNMIDVKVDPKIIRQGLKEMNVGMLLPLNFLAAARYAPDYEREIEGAMFRAFATMPKLPGRTLFAVDVSGSMGRPISSKSDLTRMDAALALAMLAGEMCENVAIYATAGSDSTRVHKTVKVAPRRGFGLIAAIKDEKRKLGGGGIFTRQLVDFLREKETEMPERIIIFSDSQDCDLSKSLPKPFGKYNYIVDVSAESRGVNFDGVWTAEISGWSEHFLAYIAAMEGASLQDVSESEQEQ